MMRSFLYSAHVHLSLANVYRILDLATQIVRALQNEQSLEDEHCLNAILDGAVAAETLSELQREREGGRPLSGERRHLSLSLSPFCRCCSAGRERTSVT